VGRALWVTVEHPWWQSSVVYQIYPRSFVDSTGDGVGDLPGIVSRLDHLHRLGVDVLWLSPVYRSPMDDNGYDISDYRDVDPTFGTLADLDALIEGLHERGMKIVMDLVVNHTSDEHPWFQESISGPDSAKRDWYWWRPARDGTTPGEPGAEPNNWGSFFSGPAWTYDERSGEYYLHLFSPKQPDLNWENPQVRNAVYDMMRWWLARGVDGFRMDVINAISKAPGLPDGRVRPGEQYGDLAPFSLDGPRMHEFLHEMHREVFSGIDRPLLLVGEMPTVTIEEARRYTDRDRQEVDMVFQFEHMQIDRGTSKWDVLPFDVRLLRSCLAAWQEGLADVGWNSLYWDNHDQPRVVSRFGDDGEHRVRSAKLLATVLHLQRGTPYVYQGDELGMTNYPFDSIEDFEDIESVNHYQQAVAQGKDPEEVLASLRAMSRDNSRTPMQWDDSPQAGFTTGQPWLAVNPNYKEVNAARQVDDPDSVFAHYQRLIRLRHEEPTVAYGDFELLARNHPTLFAYTRSYEGTELVVVANFSGDVVDAPVELADRWVDAELVLTNLAPDDTPRLAPWECRVYRRLPTGAAVDPSA
jgi:oligo-1,6-glucosidase